MICPKCAGIGMAKCLTCSGSGLIMSDNHSLTCPVCGGKGICECTKCGGTGCNSEYLGDSLTPLERFEID